MANIGIRYCYFRGTKYEFGTVQGINVNIPVINLSVQEKNIQLSGLNQNKRLLIGYEVSISTPKLLDITDFIGDLYWTTDEFINNVNKNIFCLKIKDVTFFPSNLEYNSKSDQISIGTYTLNGISNTRTIIQKRVAISEEQAKELNSQGW